MSRLADRLQKALGQKYLIEGELGSGARGVVYRAVDPRLRRAVAIKVLRPEHATATGAERFLHEARCLARIHHPSLAVVHEVGEGDGLFFYVMDLVEGQTVAGAIAAGPLPPEDVERLADGLLAALTTAHEAGIVHRDVKPANIFFTEGRVVLTDFGIAKSVPSTEASAGDESLTVDGAFVGTPAYSAPEQLEGQGDDPRSDVFSAAAVLYEAATGKRWQTVDAGGEDVWNGIPPETARVLSRGLHPSIEERWEDASDFRAALLAAYATGPGRRVPSLVWLGLIAVAVTAIAGVTLARSGALSLPGGPAELPGSIYVRCGGDGTAATLAPSWEEKFRHRFGALDIEVLGSYSRDRVRAVGAIDAGVMLGADAVLACRVVADEDTVRLFGELTDTQSGRQLWHNEFHLENPKAFQMQDSVARAIVLSVLPHLADDLLPVPGDGPSMRAILLHAQGVKFWLARTSDPTGAPLDSAEFYYELAIGQDPDYGDALAGLAEVWLARPARVLAPARVAYPIAESLANLALESDSLSPRPHAILGELARTDPSGDWGEAGDRFERAVELSSNYELGRLWYSFYLAQIENVTEARRQARLAYAGDPGRPDLATGRGLVYYLTGANDSAILVLSEAVAAHGGDFETPLWLAASYITAGDTVNAAGLIGLLDARRTDLPPAVYPMLAVGHAATGRRDEADILLELAGSESPFWQAVALWYLDRREEALEQLRRAIAANDEFMSYVNVLPLLDPMRDDPEFREMVEYVGRGTPP